MRGAEGLTCTTSSKDATRWRRTQSRPNVLFNIRVRSELYGAPTVAFRNRMLIAKFACLLCWFSTWKIQDSGLNNCNGKKSWRRTVSCCQFPWLQNSQVTVTYKVSLWFHFDIKLFATSLFLTDAATCSCRHMKGAPLCLHCEELHMVRLHQQRLAKEIACAKAREGPWCR